MNNTDLFSFQFVDRADETKVLLDFIDSEEKPNLLWVDGNSGVGKSYLIESQILNNTAYDNRVIFTTIRNNEVQEGTYLLRFLHALNNHSPLPLLEYIASNYKSILSHAGSVLWNKYAGSKHTTSLDILTQAAAFINEVDNTRSSLATLISDFCLNEISHKSFIIYDNITSADTYSATIIKELLTHLANNKSPRVIVVTTSSRLSNHNYSNFLTYELPNQLLKISPFSSMDHFREILESKFRDLQLINDNISRIFELCGGYPEQLRGFLRELYRVNGIVIDGVEARFVENQFLEHLFERKTNIDLKNISSNETRILRVMVLMNTKIELVMLTMVFNYVYFGHNSGIKQDIIANTILKFVDNDVIEPQGDDDNNFTYKFTHDSIYNYLLDHFKKEDFHRLFSYRFYLYLTKEKKLLIDYMFNEEEYRDLLAYHSYISGKDLYVDVNIEYAEYLLNKRQFLASVDIFRRLREHLNHLPDKRKMQYAIAMFEAGLYYDCASFIESVEIYEDLATKYQILGKCLFLKLQPDEAISSYEHALEYIDLNSDPISYVELTNLKQMAMTETSDKYAEAIQIYKDLVNFIEEHNIDDIIVAKVYRNATNIYSGTSSLNLLSRAIMLARKHNDDVEYAKASNNYGVELFRQGNIDEALDHFERSASILHRAMIHESSYAYNNAAVSAMVRNYSSKATEYLDCAQLYTTSDYAKLTIKINTLSSKMFGSNDIENEYNNIYNDVKSKGVKDKRVYRKILLNYALLLQFKQNKTKMKEVLTACIPYLNRAKSTHRWNRLATSIGMSPVTAPLLPKEESLYYRDLDFDPWLLTYAHD